LVTPPVLPAKNSGSACPDFPAFRPTTGPLALLNCGFHHEYEVRIKKIIQTLGASKGIPLILNLGGTLVLKYNGSSQTIDITPDAYQQVKVFDHTFFALILALNHLNSKPLSAHAQGYLHSLQFHLQQAKLLIPSLKLNQKEQRTLTQLTILTTNFIQEVLLKNKCSRERLQGYIRQAKPLVYEATVIASKIEIKALDAAINPWLDILKPADKAKIAIVVAASHQAVDNELSVQYFVKRFGSRYQVGAVPENRLLILQNAFDEESALKLLARHFLDRELSALIFNNPTYLQRDVLSEAGKKIL
jgi:hypothetical protein